MPSKKKTILRAVPRATWTPEIGRPFARVGPDQVICCDPGADIQSDAADAAELAHRWNAYPQLVEALTRIVHTGKLSVAHEALAHLKASTK
jgi:hypothetical protein